MIADRTQFGKEVIQTVLVKLKGLSKNDVMTLEGVLSRILYFQRLLLEPVAPGPKLVKLLGSFIGAKLL